MQNVHLSQHLLTQVSAVVQLDSQSFTSVTVATVRGIAGSVSAMQKQTNKQKGEAVGSGVD